MALAPSTGYPLLGTAASNGCSTITRDDGSCQIAYQRRLLYYWAKDTNPGDRSGDGFNNLWHIAKP